MSFGFKKLFLTNFEIIPNNF